MAVENPGQCVTWNSAKNLWIDIIGTTSKNGLKCWSTGGEVGS
jgi:hypothetical protein